MNNFGFNGFNNNLNNDNTLAQFLKPYFSQQSTENAQSTIEPQHMSGYSGSKTYEIMKSDDLKYIKPDNTGQKQIISCEPEKIVYVARYNYATEKPDYEKYISEGNIELFKKNDTNAEMSQVAEALFAVANKLETMHNEIQELKNNNLVPKEIKEESKKESQRRANGQFKKKGEV